ncbi:hypothetical protein OAD96_01425 [Pseudomonadales bacterium]|jgi:hypothetical protein|uniref:Uncharacterized protein n=1 Tax=SAR86 cluster bacterium TaxID=2030880 RepID=A0A972VU36_9GAMM|nr:hypothetical protein [Pseudomonadales bacterium]NQV64294.1 hypothetical protein [SAR86 cluster bacterium]MDB9867281.1 hypothetical protein [Pseudomonadales bacterium]MDB9879599.1 hypothetical protein [Pseudomonadales bacterium]MDB9942615.1 hypothetical protein [Pseudomonadales bacterium]|tara:strand:+ start:6630 stop:7067 length:438 start_codon:yes stop_codon:yes gene_type:complete
MDEQRYRVIYSGGLTGEVDEATACQQLAKLFRIDERRARGLMSGREHVIKNDVSESVAMAYLIRLTEAGCESYVQEIVDASLPAYQEKRDKKERRVHFRRSPRLGAIVPDRRLRPRRAMDIKQFRQIVRQGGAVPVAYQSYSLDE